MADGIVSDPENFFYFSREDKMAGTTRLELATSAVTGQRSNQLNYVPNRCWLLCGKLRACVLQR